MYLGPIVVDLLDCVSTFLALLGMAYLVLGWFPLCKRIREVWINQEGAATIPSSTLMQFANTKKQKALAIGIPLILSFQQPFFSRKVNNLTLFLLQYSPSNHLLLKETIYHHMLSKYWVQYNVSWYFIASDGRSFSSHERRRDLLISPQ